MLVGTPKLAEALPAATVTDAGGNAAGLSLVTLTIAPFAGASPLSMRVAPAVAPPLIVDGPMLSDFNDGGSTLNCTEAVPEFSVAGMETGVLETTWPAVNWNCIHAVFPGMLTEAGTGAAFGSELVRLMTAPAEGAAELSCSATHVVLPL